MSRVFSLAAAGALLLSTASLASAETFNVRLELLHNRFGSAHPAARLARRQDDSAFNSTDDSTSGLITSIATSTTSSVTRTGSLFSSATSTTSDDDDTYTGYWSGPDALYLAEMCMPNMFDEARAASLGIDLEPRTQNEAYLSGAKLAISLGGSPFPCEQSIYIEYACHANATTPVDFLAEQQCYCGSNFWETDQGCNKCLLAHGAVVESVEEYGAEMASFSSKVCAATPVPGGVLAAAATDLPVEDDLQYVKSVVKRPSQTAVSYYHTDNGVTVPALTGSATARATTWGRWEVSSSDGATGSSGSGALNHVVPVAAAVLGAMAVGAGMILL